MKIDLSRPELAINGGKPVRVKPWLDNFTTGEEEKQAVIKVMDTGYLSLFEGAHNTDPPFSFWGGPFVQKLEKDWCNYYNVKHAVSMNSATSGLYASIGSLGIGYGDEVITSPFTMSACAAGILVYGAIPIFADVQLETGCLNPKSIEANITQRTKAILVVHQFGIPADMDSIMELASKHNLKVIEDCAQAHGAKYKGRYVGTIGDVGVFSLNVNKTIQSGEGAICTTNDDNIKYRLALIRNHGEAVVEAAGIKDITNMVGFNYRLSELHAAIAIEQLKKLDHLNSTRIEFVKYLSNEMSKYECFIPLDRCVHNKFEDCSINNNFCKPTFYVFAARYIENKSGIKREVLIEAINSEGIKFYQGYTKPLYLQPIYQKKSAFKHGYPFSAPENKESIPNYSLGACPNAEKLHYDEIITNEHIRLPNKIEDIEDIVRAIDKVLK